MIVIAEDAERILARAWIHSAVLRFVEDGWENNPDIGEYSYDRIAGRMVGLTSDYDLPKELVEEAYVLLSKLAEDAAVKGDNNEI